SKSTSGEPDVIGLLPCPVLGHAVGSPARAAGLPDMTNLLIGIRGGTMPQGKSHRKPGLYFFGLVRTWDAPAQEFAQMLGNKKPRTARGWRGFSCRGVRARRRLAGRRPCRCAPR